MLRRSILCTLGSESSDVEPSPDEHAAIWVSRLVRLSRQRCARRDALIPIGAVAAWLGARPSIVSVLQLARNSRVPIGGIAKRLL
jgi:hypothetical protein